MILWPVTSHNKSIISFHRPAPVAWPSLLISATTWVLATRYVPSISLHAVVGVLYGNWYERISEILYEIKGATRVATRLHHLTTGAGTLSISINTALSLQFCYSSSLAIIDTIFTSQHRSYCTATNVIFVLRRALDVLPRGRKACRPKICDNHVTGNLVKRWARKSCAHPSSCGQINGRKYLSLSMKVTVGETVLQLRAYNSRVLRPSAHVTEVLLDDDIATRRGISIIMIRWWP